MIVYEGKHRSEVSTPDFGRKLGKVGPFHPDSKLENDRCAAALLLCQVAVGSRARGIIAVNQIEKVNWHLADEDLGDNKTVLRDAYSQYLNVLRFAASPNPKTPDSKPSGTT